jgi:putative transposase
VFTSFYNAHRPHQSLGNKTLPAAAEGHDPPTLAAEVGRVRCRRFLGGLLRHYYREAA